METPRMDPEMFWSLVSETHDRDKERSAEVLRDALIEAGAECAVAFQHQLDACHNALYRWDLWAVGYLLAGGMSDDSFMDFRSFIVSEGRETFELALRDPEALGLALVEYDEAELEAELWSYAAREALDELEEDGEDPLEDHPVEPEGEEWDEDEVEELLPRLAEALAVRGRL